MLYVKANSNFIYLIKNYTLNLENLIHALNESCSNKFQILQNTIHNNFDVTEVLKSNVFVGCKIK